MFGEFLRFFNLNSVLVSLAEGHDNFNISEAFHVDNVTVNLNVTGTAISEGTPSDTTINLPEAFLTALAGGTVKEVHVFSIPATDVPENPQTNTPAFTANAFEVTLSVKLA